MTMLPSTYKNVMSTDGAGGSLLDGTRFDGIHVLTETGHEFVSATQVAFIADMLASAQASDHAGSTNVSNRSKVNAALIQLQREFMAGER